MNSSWLAPYRIVGRSGEHSFVIRIDHREDRDVHYDQLKPCLTHPATESMYPMVFRKGDPLTSTVESQITRVLEAKETPEGLEFRVEWSELAGGNQTWVPARTLSPIWVQAFEKARALTKVPMRVPIPSGVQGVQSAQ